MITPMQIMFSNPEVSKPLTILGEFGQNRIRETITAGTTSRFTIPAPTDRGMYIFRYRFGNVTANALNFKFDNVENMIEKNILIGTELLNFDTRPFPFILCRDSDSSIVVQNTSTQDVVFEMVYDYILVHREAVERYAKMIKATGLGVKSMIE